MQKHKRIIRAAEAKAAVPANFRSFDKRPVNYFRDVISDEERDNNALVSEQEIQARVEDALASERQKMQERSAREAQEKYKAGLAKGREEASGDFKRAAELLNEYSRILQAERKEMIERYETSAVKLAFSLAEKILGNELETNPERVATVARNAIQQVTDARQICLRVNPQDAEYLRTLQADLISQLSTSAQLEIRGDASVQRGGCLVETENGSLDARIESQLNTLRAGLESSATDEQN
jgi:flagellar assembly protein FliH